jgi:hypothetical protein
LFYLSVVLFLNKRGENKFAQSIQQYIVFQHPVGFLGKYIRPINYFRHTQRGFLFITETQNKKIQRHVSVYQDHHQAF